MTKLTGSQLFDGQAWTRSLVYLIIILLSIALIDLTKPIEPFRPQGIVLPLAPPLPAIKPEKVMVYTNDSDRGQSLAMLNLEFHVEKPSELAEATIIEQAKTLAAGIGANGLLIHSFGYSQPLGGDGEFNMYVLRSVAFVKKNEG